MLYLHPRSKSLLQKVRQFSKSESEGKPDKQHKMRGMPYAATAFFMRGLIGLKRKVIKNELRTNDLTSADLDYLENLKNLVGTFALPEKVFVDVNFLKTLPKDELISGFAEMLKHGLVADQLHWKNLIEINEITLENVAPYIKESMQIKQNIVEQDFYEKNIRKILNFGHTIGHAVESLYLKSGNPISHGQAVAIGMICETRLSFLEKFITEDISNEIICNITKYFPHSDLTFENKKIIALMKNDKKNHHSKIQFSLVDQIGSCLFNIECSEKNILDSIDYYKKSLRIS